MQFTFKHGSTHHAQPYLDMISKCVKDRWYKVTITKLGKKTLPQLGYYYGLLLPEIHKQLVADGQTKNFNWLGKEIQVKLSEDDVHQALKEVCAVFGNEPKRDITEMTERTMGLFIDNVLRVAGELGMDVEKLKVQM